MGSEVDYCAQTARENGASLVGTAAQADVWILLEHRGVWRANAVEDNELRRSTKSWLKSQTVQIENSRIVFIRRANLQYGVTGGIPQKLRCYIAVTRENDQRLYRFDLAFYGALEELDVAEVVAGKRPELQCDEKLVLVCTNGKRDRCCATFGRPVYDRFVGERELSIWQATHLGGHRYAAVAAVFPAGIYYGYLNPELVPVVAETVRNDEVHLPSYRGRVFYTGVVSAGDYFLRKATGVDGVEMISAENPQENRHIITFESTNSRHVVQLDATMSDPVLVGCTADKFKPQPIYKLRQITHIQK